MTAEEFEAQIAEAVDNRREEITRIQRVAAHLSGTPLEQTAALMALPMLYAHWEGFVKEVIELYIEYIEKKAIDPSKIHPTILCFSMKQRIKKLINSGSVEHMTKFAAWIIKNISHPMQFDDRNIETKSNLSFENLKALCDTLRIDVDQLEGQKRKINGLVHLRNNIAHTGRPLPQRDVDVEDRARFTMELIESFERILRECVVDEQFMLATVDN